MYRETEGHAFSREMKMKEVDKDKEALGPGTFIHNGGYGHSHYMGKGAGG